MSFTWKRIFQINLKNLSYYHAIYSKIEPVSCYYPFCQKRETEVPPLPVFLIFHLMYFSKMPRSIEFFLTKLKQQCYTGKHFTIPVTDAELKQENYCYHNKNGRSSHKWKSETHGCTTELKPQELGSFSHNNCIIFFSSESFQKPKYWHLWLFEMLRIWSSPPGRWRWIRRNSLGGISAGRTGFLTSKTTPVITLNLPCWRVHKARSSHMFEWNVLQRLHCWCEQRHAHTHKCYLHVLQDSKKGDSFNITLFSELTFFCDSVSAYNMHLCI